MPANAVKTFSAETIGDKLVVDVTTWLPAAPSLLVFCCPYRLIPKTRKRGGQTVPHGNLLYMDCVPKRFDAANPGDTVFHWEVAATDYVPGCNNCHLAIVEFGLTHPLDWTTQVHPCPCYQPPAIYMPMTAGFTGPLPPASNFVSVAHWWRPDVPAFGGIWSLSDSNGDPDFTQCIFYTGSGDGSHAGVSMLSEFPDPTAPTSYATDMDGIALGVWQHLAYVLDCVTGTASAWLNGQPLLIDAVLTPGDWPLLFAAGGTGPWRWNTFPLGAFQVSGSLSELWFSTTQDLRTLADPGAAFVSATGCPVPLGDNGELVTGTPPEFFGHGDAATFMQPNLGSIGGNLLIGALAPQPIPPRVGA